jgi:anti-sigma-K factor RskA
MSGGGVVKLLPSLPNLPGRDVHGLAGVYALNALTGPEQTRFERHMDGCDNCVHEVRGLHQTASELALAVAAEPPPGFRERVLAAVPSVPQLPAVSAAPAVSAVPDLPGLAAEPPLRGITPESARHSVRPRPGRRRPAHKLRRRSLAGGVPKIAIGVAAVTTAVALVLGLRLISVQNQLNVSRHKLTISELELSISKAEQAALTRSLNTPGVRVLAATTGHGGYASAVHVPGQPKVILLTKDLPVLPVSKVYQAWLIGAKVHGVQHIRSAGLLARVPAGGTTFLVASGVLKGDTVAITVEPAGGTKQPTTTPFVLLPLVR